MMAASELGLIPTASHAVTRQVLSKELIEIGKLQGVHEELYLLTGGRKIPNPIAARLISEFVV